MSRWLIIAGLVLVVVGLLLHFLPGSLNWFGRLPGDIRFETARGKFFFPLTSMILVSVVLTLLLHLFRR